MTEKELRRLSRSALMELLIEQMEENSRLEEQMQEMEGQKQELEEKLKDRSITMANAGSIADAALQLNHVFDAAEQAAAQYVENVQAAYDRCTSILSTANQRAVMIVQQAQSQAQQIIQQAQEEAASIRDRVPEPAVFDGDLDDLFNSAFQEMKSQNRRFKKNTGGSK